MSSRDLGKLTNEELVSALADDLKAEVLRRMGVGDVAERMIALSVLGKALSSGTTVHVDVDQNGKFKTYLRGRCDADVAVFANSGWSATLVGALDKSIDIAKWSVNAARAELENAMIKVGKR